MESEQTYLQVELLGQGPVTEVWKAFELDKGRHVALKTPRQSEDGIDFARKLLAHEALVSQSIQHRALPRILDFETNGPEPFLCMKLLAGENLESRKKSGIPWTLMELIDSVSSIAEGLEALHRAGWVHGDVQPGNIFLERNGNTRLIDLGGAHLPNQHPYVETPMESELVGSADYWAPEICRSNGVGGPPADLFALGILIFEILSGQRPWSSGSLRETIKRHHGDPSAPLKSSWCRIPRRLKHLVESMLARTPDARPTAGLVADELGVLAIRLMERGVAA